MEEGGITYFQISSPSLGDTAATVLLESWGVGEKIWGVADAVDVAFGCRQKRTFST